MTFWRACGFDPSLVVGSGHGLQVYWCLLQTIPAEQGEPVLKEMVRLAGCTKGGNTWDVTRILRLPYFHNMKHWYNDDTPAAYILQPTPDTVDKMVSAKSMLPRYEFDRFRLFPESTKRAIATLTQEAQYLPGDFAANLQTIVAAKTTAEQHSLAVEVGEAHVKPAIDPNIAKEVWMPTKTVVPLEIDDIPFPRGKKKWLILYAKKGWDGLTPKEIESIHKIWPENSKKDSASELDAALVYNLIRLGYNWEAVREFFHRGSLKLGRPKVVDRDDYLRRTFENMLAGIQASKAGVRDCTQTPVGMIMVDPYGMLSIMEPRGPRQIFNGNLILKRIWTNVDTGDAYFECNTITTDANNQEYHEDVLIPKSAFDTAQAIRESLRELNYFTVYTKCSETLARVRDYIRRARDVEHRNFHVNMQYDPKAHMFIYPQIQITATDQIITKSLPITDTRFPWYSAFIDKPVTKEDGQLILRTIWPSLMQVHMPSVVCSLIGLIAATAMREIIDGKKIGDDDIHLPIVNLRGAHASGKTSTVRLFLQLTGATPQGAGQLTLSLASSTFALSRMPDLVRFIPVVIDEFKERGHNDKRIESARELLQQAFSGEHILKGRPDLSVTAQSTKSRHILMGESMFERLGNLAEWTRIFPIDTSGFVMAAHAAAWDKCHAVNLAPLGPLFYQFLLNLDPAAEYERFKSIRQETEKYASLHFTRERARVAANLSTLIWGCALYDQFVLTLCPELAGLQQTLDVRETLIHGLLKESAAQRAQLNYHLITQDGVKKYVASRDEILDFLYTLSILHVTRDDTLLKMQDKRVLVFHVDEELDLLSIHMPSAYQAVRVSCVRQQIECIDQRIITNRLNGAIERAEPWVIAKTRQMKYEGRPYRVVDFRLSALREMEIWCSTELGEKAKDVGEKAKHSEGDSLHDVWGFHHDVLGEKTKQ